MTRPMRTILRHTLSRSYFLGVVFLLVAHLPAFGKIGALADDSSRDEEEQKVIGQMSLEELLQVEITSVTRTPQHISDAAASVHVITQEDIRRSGATSIPELLRTVPGLHVARLTANIWAISARGFNAKFADRMLVQLDGRSLYTPLFSGVYWDVQDTILEDIDRIEIIRGSGASVWGANAVNGIINIITKRSEDTQGGLLTFGTSAEEPLLGSFRFGGRLGEKSYYRFFTKGFRRDSSRQTNGEPAPDEWQAARVGFRFDRELESGGNFRLQGDWYEGQSGRTEPITTLEPPFMLQVSEDTKLGGGNVLGSWQHVFSADSDTVLQLYYDRSRRDLIHHHQLLDVFDIDFQHRLAFPQTHELLWGLNYRHVEDELAGTFTVTFDPDRRSSYLASAFFQDLISLDEDRWQITIGSKFENNSYTGFEILPNARMRWRLADEHTIWGAVSRSVRLPSRANSDIRINVAVFPGRTGMLNLLSIFGNTEIGAEELFAREVGYRFRPTDRLYFDVSGFYYVYDDLISTETSRPFFEVGPSGGHMVLPQTFSNVINGETYGLELAASWKVLDRWDLSAWYSWFQPNIRFKREETESTTAENMEDMPRHQAHVRSHVDITGDWSVDSQFNYVDEMNDVPSIFRIDISLTWRPTLQLMLSGGVRNLLDDRHLEFISRMNPLLMREIERDVFLKMTWSF